MTDKQQPEALELASVAESADLAGYPTAKKANAYYLCLLEDCAQMIRKLHAENESLIAERERNLASIRVNNEIINRKNAELETLALYKNMADEYGLSIFPDIAEMTAELETLRAKLKTYEDLGDAGSDVQLLRMGYAAARLEIESLRARSPIPPNSVEYPALPEPLEIDWPELHSYALGCGIEDRGLHNRYECAEYGWQDGVDKCAECVPEQIFDADQMRAYVDADRAMRAAQPAGAQRPDTDPELLKFYGVATDSELIAAQARHIERLQAKLPQTPSFAPQWVREG